MLTKKYNATEDQLLLAWILQHPSGVLPVVGTTSKVRLENATKALDINLELEDWFTLLVECQGHKVPVKMINKRLLIKNLLSHNDENSFYDKKMKLSLTSKEGKGKFLKHICALSNSNPTTILIS